jgi:hypothetical protein
MSTTDTLPAESLYVTLAAARTYQEHQRCGDEQARRELTGMLLGARLTADAEPGRPAAYRHRSRATQIDVTARVVREGGLWVVVAASVREYR